MPYTTPQPKEIVLPTRIRDTHHTNQQELLNLLDGFVWDEMDELETELLANIVEMYEDIAEYLQFITGRWGVRLNEKRHEKRPGGPDQNSIPRLIIGD